MEVLKAIGLYGQVQPPSGPEDAELVLWEEAREWAEMEFKKQRPSIGPLMAYTLGGIEIPELAQERMKELRDLIRRDRGPVSLEPRPVAAADPE